MTEASFSISNIAFTVHIPQPRLGCLAVRCIPAYCEAKHSRDSPMWTGIMVL